MNNYIRNILCFFIYLMISFNSYATEIEKTTYSIRRDMQLFSVAKIDYLAQTDPFLFVSLSDVIPYGGNDENIQYIPEKNLADSHQYQYSKRQYLITKPYRANLMKDLGLSENDQVFIYDYALNRLIMFKISELKALAVIDLLSYQQNGPFYGYQYMLGFAITPPKAFDPATTLVYFGKQNPFAQQKLTLLKWEKIDNQRFPKTNDFEVDYSKPIKYLLDRITFLANANGLRYLVQYYQNSQRLIIEDSKANIIADFIHVVDENNDLWFLNGNYNGIYYTKQWSGYLFENQSLVVFGFERPLSGCPTINFINPSYDRLVINCDYRHLQPMKDLKFKKTDQ